MSPQVNHMSDEVLTDLAMNLLPGGHASKAVEHIASCSACEERFRGIAAEWESSAARVDEILSQARRADHARASTPSAYERYVHPNIKWAVTAAALIVIAMIVPMLVPEPDEGPVATKLPPLTRDVLPRAVISGEQNEVLMKGLNAYAEDDLDKAIVALQQVTTEGPIDALRRVYLANALTRQGRFNEALNILEPVPLELVPDPWSSEAQWTQYVAFVRSGQTDRAQTVLEALAEQPTAAGARARAIMNALD